MATRYDFTPIQEQNFQYTPEGFLFCKAVFARDGVLEYRQSDGSVRRELRLPEENANPDTLFSYGSSPVTIEHPPELVDAHNSSRLQVGASDPESVYEQKYSNGFVSGVVRIYRADAVDEVRSGRKRELSIGYRCDIEHKPGTWKGQPYDAIQRNVRVNHIAITKKGRAGSEVGLRLDSLDESDSDVGFASISPPYSSRKRMSQINLDGVIINDVPESVAIAYTQARRDADAAQKRLDALEAKLEQQTETLDSLRTDLQEVENLKEMERGRADALEIQLEEMREDMEGKRSPRKRKHMAMMEEDEENEDMDDEENEDMDDMEEEEEYFPPKKRKDMKRKDMKRKHDSEDGSDEDEGEFGEEVDDISDRLDAWMQAEALVPGITRSDSYNANLSGAEIRQIVLAHLRPDWDLTGASPSYIQGRFDSLLEEEEPEQRHDSYGGELSAVLSHARQSGSGTPLDHAIASHLKETSEAYLKPLSFSKESLS